MTHVLLIACPKCREKFSALSDTPLPPACPICEVVFNEIDYTMLRYRAHLVTRELEQGAVP